MVNDIAAGSIGGTVGTLLNTPMDVVKSRIQNSPKVAGAVPKYNWAWPAVGTVMKEEGFAALYKGFLPKVLRLGPVSERYLQNWEAQNVAKIGGDRVAVFCSLSSRVLRTSSER